MADFTEAQIETGDGAATALVYESIADLIAAGAFLELRGYGSLASGTEETQKAAMLLATDKVEAALRPFLRGVRLSSAQARLWPLAGAYGADRVLLASDAVPSAFLDGWRVACEKQHAGTIGADPDPNLASVDSIQTSETRPGENAGSQSLSIQRRPGAARDPIHADLEIWRHFAPILPP